MDRMSKKTPTPIIIFALREAPGPARQRWARPRRVWTDWGSYKMEYEPEGRLQALSGQQCNLGRLVGLG